MKLGGDPLSDQGARRVTLVLVLSSYSQMSGLIRESPSKSHGEVRLRMLLQVIAGAAWMIWLTSGTGGLKGGLTVGAFLIMGFGLKNLLDTFWKHKDANKHETRKAESEHKQTSRFSPLKQRSLPSPNWDIPRTDVSDDSSVLHRFERRLVDPRI